MKIARLAASVPFISAFTNKTEPFQFNAESLVLNERAKRILSQVVPLSFDGEGNLEIKGRYDRKGERVVSIPTKRSIERQSTNDKVKEVKLMVVHYDGASRFRSSGKIRNARNTVYGVDGKLASVNWCIDEFDINTKGNDDVGYGILQT